MTWVKLATQQLAAVAVVCIAFLGGRAEACVVCIPYPEDTITDQLLQADVVVFARENPDKPFSYISVDVLKGDLHRPDIDLFVNSTTRRRLAFNPGDFVVLAHDGSTDEWQTAGYATLAYQSLVGRILAEAPNWYQPGRTESRAAFFLPYLADEDRSVHELAYLEVGRASYDTIRCADSFVPPAQVHRFLADSRYIEWHALYILLLGVEATPDEKATIRAAMERHAQFEHKLNLGAWATALIEIDEVDAIDWLEAAYLGARDREPDTVVEIVKALSVHGAREDFALRGRIAESYGVLIQTHPSLAGWAARDLASWNDWRFADALAELRDSQLTMDGANAFAIDSYIGRARSELPN